MPLPPRENGTFSRCSTAGRQAGVDGGRMLHRTTLPDRTTGRSLRTPVPLRRVRHCSSALVTCFVVGIFSLHAMSLSLASGATGDVDGGGTTASAEEAAARAAGIDLDSGVTPAFAVGATPPAQRGLFCRRCGAKISTAEHYHKVPHDSSHVQLLPELAQQAEVARFRNPNSMWFDVVTFKRVTNVIGKGPLSRKHTFFPPFRWQPIYCKSCGAHIGWKFTAKRKPDKTCPLQLDLPPMTAPVAPSAQPRPLQDDEDASSVDSSPTDSTVDMNTPVRKILAHLEGFCAALQRGYWTYEWCFKKHVRQFHLEPRPGSNPPSKNQELVTINGVQYSRTPDYSLGRWNKEAHTSRAMRDRHIWTDVSQKGSMKEPKFVSHLHTGGQRCDETDDARRTEVRMICCTEKKDAKSDKTATDPNLGSKWEGVLIRDIEETSVCRYRLQVCVPALCKRADFREEGTPAPGAHDLAGSPNKQRERQQRKLNQQARESQKRCTFFGLLWPRLLLQDSPSYRWIASAKPILGISQ